MSVSNYRVTVIVRPLDEVVDPEGDTIELGLHQLGFEGVANVRSGKVIEMVVSAADAIHARSLATEMSEKLLANPLIERFDIEIGQGSVTQQ